MSISAHQAKYYAHELSSSQDGDGVERLSQSLFDAKVELKPHQIDAALFALKYPLREGVLLADEVGLGKTIEAGLVLCQLWAERKRNILIVCPASLRKQWVQELADKFALPAQVIDQTIIQKSRLSLPVLLAQNSGRYIMVMSYPFAAKQADTLLAHTWDWVVMDEAHKLRNAHRKNNRTGQALKQAFAGRKKMLLTATPLQNSLMELYGLSTLLDEHLFGDEKEFRRQFIQKNDTEALRGRMNGFVQRTLRRDVLEYINYTRRHTLTQRFTPSDNEHALYEAISAFLQKEESYALPARQRHLTGLILRRLLASSPQAVAGTLEVMRTRLMEMQKTQQNNIVADLLAEDDFSSDYQDWEESESDDDALQAWHRHPVTTPWISLPHGLPRAPVHPRAHHDRRAPADHGHCDPGHPFAGDRPRPTRTSAQPPTRHAPRPTDTGCGLCHPRSCRDRPPLAAALAALHPPARRADAGLPGSSTRLRGVAFAQAVAGSLRMPVCGPGRTGPVRQPPAWRACRQRGGHAPPGSGGRRRSGS